MKRQIFYQLKQLIGALFEDATMFGLLKWVDIERNEMEGHAVEQIF